MKKFLNVAFVAISALALFAGCKQNGDPENTELPKSVGTNPFINDETDDDYVFFDDDIEMSGCFYFTKDKVIVGRSFFAVASLSDLKTANEVNSESENSEKPYNHYDTLKECSYSWNTETNLLVLKPNKINDPTDESGNFITIKEYAKKYAERMFDEEYQKEHRRGSIIDPVEVPTNVYNIVADETESSEDPVWDDYWAYYIASAKERYGLEESATIDDLVKAAKNQIYATESKLEYYSYFLGNDYLGGDEKYLSLSSFIKPGLSLIDYYKKYTIPNSFHTDKSIRDYYIVINSELIQVILAKDYSKAGVYTVTDITDSVIKVEYQKGNNMNDLTEIPYTASLDDEDPSKWTIDVTIYDTEYTLNFDECATDYPEIKR